MTDPQPYNPLDKGNLGASVAEALLGRRPRALGALVSFKGAGIYAIYYRGPFPAYSRIAQLNQGDDPQAPIYVGKAIPAGGRKGAQTSITAVGNSLFKRLKEHAESIDAVGNLSVDDFVCRHLVVDDIWIPLGESLLIAKFAPLWNSNVDGFGNHDPGKGRYEGQIPRWDVLHPGRVWAAKCRPRLETADQIAREVEARLELEPSLARSRFLVEQQRGQYSVSQDEPD
jgi:Eco29kI restriction endonuclease